MADGIYWFYHEKGPIVGSSYSALFRAVQRPGLVSWHGMSRACFMHSCIHVSCIRISFMCSCVHVYVFMCSCACAHVHIVHFGIILSPHRRSFVVPNKGIAGPSVSLFLSCHFWGVPSLVFIVALRCVGCCRPLNTPPPARPNIGSVTPFCLSGRFCNHPTFERLSVLIRRRFLTKTNAILIWGISVNHPAKFTPSVWAGPVSWPYRNGTGGSGRESIKT
jgi:hypothetical protein